MCKRVALSCTSSFKYRRFHLLLQVIFDHFSLFPTMPRHNLYKVAPLVLSLCKKHHIPYTVKPLFTAFGDIVR